MPDVIEILTGALCQQNTVSQCQSFLQSYPEVTQQLLFFLFFPAIFLILFIVLLSSRIAESVGKKYSTLLGVAFFILIVVQGWYHIFLWVSRLWFLFIFVIVGFVVLAGLTKGSVFRKKGGGGARELASAGGRSLMREAILGRQELDPVRRARNVRLCNDRLKELKKQRQKLEESLSKVSSEKERSELVSRIADIDKQIISVEERKSEGNPPD